VGAPGAGAVGYDDGGGHEDGEQEAEAGPPHGGRSRRGAHVPVGFVSFAHAVAVTGIGKYRIGEAVKRAGVPVYRSPADARRKYIREEDVERLTAAVPEIPEPPDAGSAEAPEAT
jgi:hypothetical protein